MALRKITIRSGVGQNKRVVETDAELWGDLIQVFQKEGVQIDGMTAVVGENQMTLVSPEGVLLREDFTIYLSPQRVKSGI